MKFSLNLRKGGAGITFILSGLFFWEEGVGRLHYFQIFLFSQESKLRLKVNKSLFKVPEKYSSKFNFGVVK